MAEESESAGGPPAGGPANGSAAGAGAPRKRGKGGMLLLAAVLVIAALCGGYWYVRLRGVVSTDDAYVDGDRATISTKVLGRIDTLGADEGDTVHAGQLLIRLDDADLRAHLAEAQAALALAQRDVTLADVNETRAADDDHRAAVQLRGAAISQEQYDHAHMAYASAQAEQQIALAKVQSARTAIDVIRQEIADTRVTAPFYGVVARRWLLPGDVVQPGQPVLTLYDVDSVWVTAVFEETKLRYLPIGTDMDLSIDAYPNRHFHGHVVLIGAAAASQFSLIPPDNASGNFTKVTQRIPVRIAIDQTPGPAGADPPIRLIPGMSVVVTAVNPR
jgi:membrane fusion protein, multidrug efflux system